ncbi:PHB depolymerase family esterase [Niveibacterium umoris]|uniref:Polyhydroxybutyrate depolymerase n=2 Tax=Niveibacterium umoris TaxID=1193620 RepID=A0A840BT28_9RHOO|nr:polyhydroxybutyrate depolymerase [Niveibacterium umoris]
MRIKCLVIACLSIFIAAAASGATVSQAELQRPEGVRHYLVATPVRSDVGKHPLIVLLHGHTGSAAQVLGQKHTAAPMSTWLAIADREGLVVVAPDGARGDDGKQGWNDCRGDASSNPKTDDVGFIDAIIAREIAEHAADPDRVFVMGMSNGGMMAFRQAIESRHGLAGFATIGASMALQNRCRSPLTPVTALVVAGTADPLVPYTGGTVGFHPGDARGGVIGVEKAVDVWRRLAALPDTPATVTTFEHRDASDPTRAIRTVWGEDPKRVQVELVKISGGGHIEPSITQRIHWPYTKLVGKQNGDFDIAEEAWLLFKNKRRAEPH